MKPSDYPDRHKWWWAAINSHVNHKASAAVKDNLKTVQGIAYASRSNKSAYADEVDILMDAWGEGR